MKWIEIGITTTSKGTEYVEAMLLCCGLSEWQVIDYDEMRSFLAEHPQQWDYVDERTFEDDTEYVTVKFYATDNESGKALIETVKTGLSDLKSTQTGVDLGSLAISLRQVDDETWLDSWKAYFKPLEIGSKIVIKPAWEQYTNTGKIVVDLDPGHVFGTGQHETTRLCIEALERCTEVGDTMLDLGCGSGILSVIGIMLGAEKCIAVDFDPNAADITYHNAERNGIAKDKLSVLTGDIINCPHLYEQIIVNKYDIITANIVADTVIKLSAMIAEMNCLKPGGVFITSGIIADRAEEVYSALKNAGFNDVKTDIASEWVCLTACK